MDEEHVPKVIGKLSRELRTTASIEWDVPDFFGLEEGEDHIDSPEFHFMGAEWCLWAYPYGRKKNNSVGWIELYLVRKNSIFKSRYLECRLGIRKKDGTEYHAFEYERNFTKNEESWGIYKVMKRSELLKDNDQTAAKKSVKFFCRFHAKVNENEVTESQTIPYENLQTLVENLKELLNGEDGDVVLKVQSKEFKAHRAVLKVRSPVFRSMFNHRMKEDISGVVEITDCDPTAFGDFLHFVYCGKVEKFSKARVFDLYFVADKYDVIELKTMCTDSIIDNLSRETFFDALALALKYQESTVWKHATEFFIENAIQIVEATEWLSFQKENPVAANELFIKMLRSKIPAE